MVLPLLNSLRSVIALNLGDFNLEASPAILTVPRAWSNPVLLPGATAAALGEAVTHKVGWTDVDSPRNEFAPAGWNLCLWYPDRR